MASVNLQNLQRTANRYAKEAGFAPIAADGGMGASTENAVKKALAHVAGLGFFTEMLVSDGVKGVAQGFLDEINRASSPQTVIMQRNVDINTVLTRAADDLGLKAPAQPVTAPAQPGFITPTVGVGVPATTAASAATAGVGAGVLDVFKTMSTPMKLTLAGLAAGIGYFAFFDGKKKKRR